MTQAQAGGSGTDPVLAARLAVPRLPGGFVRRPRLLRQLTEAVDRPLTLVNGPAGAGKSLLAADWTRRRAGAGDVVWLTAEREDDVPGVFWASLFQALRHAGLDLPDEAAAGPAQADAVGQPLLVRLAAHLAARREPLILVIDQFERVPGADVAAGLDYLLSGASSGLRLVLISRGEPLLPLHRYRLAGEITEIRARDLAFLPEECARLVGSQGLSLCDDAVRALTDRTEGWAAGLRLCALAAQQSDNPEVYLKDFEAGETTLADFLLAEVLAIQSAEAQDLVLRTSILEQTHVELANTLTGRRDAARILDGLAHTNAFVEPIGHRWYRHHPLFAEILRYRLRSRDPGLEAELHRRAARWLCERGRLADALPHAAAAGDWELAAEQLVEGLAVGWLFAGLEAGRLRRLFADMPPRAGGVCPELVRAASALTHQDANRALAHLERAEACVSVDGGPAAAVELTRAFLHVLAASLTGSADEAEDCAAAAEALECQTPDGQLAGHPELPGLLHAALGSACLWEGRFDRARSAFTRAVEVSADPAGAATRQAAMSRLALIDLLRGAPGRAQAKARAAIIEAEHRGLSPSPGTSVAHLVLARAAFERDELAVARAGLENAAACEASGRDPIVTAGVAVLRSRLLLADGDPAAALEALAPAWPAPWVADSVRTPSPWAWSEAAEAASAAHLAQGDPAAAADTAARAARRDPACAVALARARLAADGGAAALETLDEAGAVLADRPPAVAVRALLVRARAAQCAGDETAAARRLAQALTVARPDRLRRPFRETGEWVRRLLLTHPGLVEAHTWLPGDLRAGLPGAGSPARSDGGVLVEPLSVREREVLERAAQMMSTREIADDLYLSVNTVKTHLKNINRKLCATRRAEAVRRARRLRML